MNNLAWHLSSVFEGGKRRPSFGLAVAVPLLCLATIPVPVKGLFDSSSVM